MNKTIYPHERLRRKISRPTLAAPASAAATRRKRPTLAPAAMLAIAALLAPGSAIAQVGTVIDNFQADQLSDQPGVTSQGAEDAASSQERDDILGRQRDIAVQRASGSAGEAAIQLDDNGSGQPNGNILFSNTDGTGRATIIWDGVDGAAGTGAGAIDFDGLRADGAAGTGADLTFGGLTDTLQVVIPSSNRGLVDFIITLYNDSETNAAVLTKSNVEIRSGAVIEFPISEFVVANGASLDINDVGAIRFDLVSVDEKMDVELDILEATASVTVSMVDKVLNSDGVEKDEPAVPGDTIRYTVTVENPDDPGGLASTPLQFTFDPALTPTNGLTRLVPGSVLVAGQPAEVVIDEGNGNNDTRVLVSLPAIPDRDSADTCPTDNSVSGCVSFTFDVVIEDVLPPEDLRAIAGESFIPAQGTLTSRPSDPDIRIITTLVTNDPDVLSPPRDANVEPRENLTRVAICGNGNLEGGEGCDDGNLDDGDGCNAICLIESIEERTGCSISDCVAPPSDCTPGSDDCPRCNDVAPGSTGDDSCASGVCSMHNGVAVCTNCGDGQVDAREGCDNPGREANEECTASCLIKSCPNGIDCDSTCTITPGAPSDPSCHACDSDDQCESKDCYGDEDGMGICFAAICGNGVLEFGEGCDDGNTADDDGCNSACLIESKDKDCRIDECPDTSCVAGSPNCPACNTTSPGNTGDASCASGFCSADGFCQECGDGNLDGFEGCDPGDQTDGDGCSAVCLIEDCPVGQSCPTDPTCTPGAPNCNICNSDTAGATGDASCASDFCDPSTNTCGPRLPRLGGGGCAASSPDLGLGLTLLIPCLLLWLRRRRHAAGAAALLAVALAVPHAAQAQEQDARNFSAERFRLSSDRDGILDVESGSVIGHLSWDLGFWVGYADDPLALYMDDGEERIDPFLTRRIGGELVGAIGFGKRLQLGVQIPVILNQSYGFMDASLAPDSSAGIGDISVHPKLQLLFVESSGVDLALIPTITLPSRGTESYFGDISLTFAPMLAASRRINRIGLGANVGYRARTNTPEILGLQVADEAFIRFGASYRVINDIEKPLDVGLSASLATAAADILGIFNRNHAEGLLGASYQVTRDWNLFTGAGVGLNPGFGTPDWRLLAGLRFSRRPLVCEQPLVERDGRCAIACESPYVESGGQCVLPPCPTGFERVGAECVMPVRCDSNPPNKDADCDTLPAPPWIQLGPPDEAYEKDRTEPKTPDEPVNPDGYKFGATVPVEEGESDFPATVDQYDYCPTVPGAVEHHGCPAPTVVPNQCVKGEGRGDITVGPTIEFLPGLAVLTLPSRVPLEELARTVAKDAELLVAINVGSPEADRDLAQRRADAIAAFLQQNGVNTDHLSIIGYGSPASTANDDSTTYPVSFERRCPKDIPSKTICGSIELDESYKIEYEVNSAKLRPASKEMLKRDLLWILEAHPQVRVDVQGHTSSEGALQYNMDLSQRRAQSVVDYLVGEGISPDRLSAVGHGPKIPLVSPERSESDREKNRRIEFSLRPRKECDDCEKFEVGKIQFEYNSGVIKSESFAELDSVVRKLLAYDAVHLLIEGHTSSEGRAGYNRRLSSIRAAAVRKYLVDKGIPASRLRSKGFGEDKLLIPNDETEEQKETNRRVEFTITRGKPECPE